MPTNIKLAGGYTPDPGGVFSVPVALEYSDSDYVRHVGEPEDASMTVWNSEGLNGPIATGDRAHLFCSPDRVFQTSPQGAKVLCEDDYKLAILATIQNAIENDLPLTEWNTKLGNAYTYRYVTPHDNGIEVGLTTNNYDAIPQRFTQTNIDPSVSGRLSYYHYGPGGTGTTDIYFSITENDPGSGWVQDGIVRDNMYAGVRKEYGTNEIIKYSINNLKSSFSYEDVNTKQIEVYRGIRFEESPLTPGELRATDIFVAVDWTDTQTYNVFDGWDEHGLPLARATTGPKAVFVIPWLSDVDFDKSLTVEEDPLYEGDRWIDVYPAAPGREFSFIPLSGGGGGGDNGKGGRPVSSAIPMRITSSGDVDYRHFLDLYDETNYPERNMFLTNFVGRIPYRLIEFDSSESGGTGIIRVQTDLQFTHFVGASFSDANVPRVYEVISHRSMGGSPNVLLCTFRVCHLKDYFQHFGVTSENEFLVQRSTYAGLYNPWIKDSRLFSEEVVEEGWNYGSGGFNFGLNSALITLTSGEAIILPLTSGYPGYSYTEPMYPNYDHAWFYQITSLDGLINCAEDVDSDPKSSLYSSAFVNALLSKIKNVYMVSSQMVSSVGSSGSVQVKCDLSYSTDPDDPEGSLYTQIAIASFSGVVVTNPEWPKAYTAGFLGSGSFTDWTDLDANYQMLIPWYGAAEISGVELKRILDAGSGSIGVQYLVSCLDGTISIAIGGSSGKIIRPWKSLPKIAIPASSRTLSYKQTNEQISREAGVRDDQTLFSAVASVGVGVAAGGIALLTGNPIAAAAAVGSGVATAVGTVVSNDLRDRAAAIGSYIAKSNITFSSTTCDGYEMLAIQVLLVVKVKKKEVLNVYSAIGYPCRALWRSVGAVNGRKYWVTILGTIRGTSSYAQAVLGEIERDGIIYNYS